MSKITVLLVDDHEGFINAALRHLRKVEWLEVVGKAFRFLGYHRFYPPVLKKSPF